MAIVKRYIYSKNIFYAFFNAYGKLPTAKEDDDSEHDSRDLKKGKN